MTRSDLSRHFRGRRFIDRSPTAIGIDSGRDHAIDRLRGLCLLSMIFGHLTISGEGPSVINPLLHALGWISGAEGFVFLSGVSVGLLWRSKGEIGSETRRWTLTRAAVLLLVHLVLNLSAIAWSELIHPMWWVPSSKPSLLQLLTGTWMIPFGDVLPMYVAFLIAAVAVAPWTDRRPGRLLAAAVGLYLVGLTLAPLGPMRRPGDVVWDLLAWQLIFTVGLVAGRHWSAVRARIERHHVAVLAMGALSALAIGVLRATITLSERGMEFADRPHWRVDFEAAWLDKVSMQPLRILLVFTFGPAAYYLCRYRLPFDRLVVRAGSRSLRVYAVSTLACLIPATMGPINGVLANDLIVTVLTVAVLATASWPTLWRGKPWSI